MNHICTLSATVLLFGIGVSSVLAQEHIEVSDDGHDIVFVVPDATDGTVTLRGSEVPFGTAPDWQNAIRRQVGGLQVADMNSDGHNDVVVGCYISNSFPPYDVWRNYIYYNTGGQLEAVPSWVSDNEVSTGDVQVGDIDGDGNLDIFAGNGGFAMSASVIYLGDPNGPDTSPDWVSNEPGQAWNNYAILYDVDHDDDLDVVTANQGNSQFDPYRPMYLFRNRAGVLDSVPTWQSAESSIQNFLAFGDLDGDGWEDLAVSKWANFESGVYRNVSGTLQTTPVWTTGDTDTDKGVAWADVDDNNEPDLALGHGPTLLYSNNAGVLTQTWLSTAPFHGHSDLRFCDIDSDGDADLAETHFSDGKVHIYLNRNGVLDAAPSWTYDSPTVGTAIAFGDINGDDLPDLVVGNSGDPCVKVFYNTGLVCPGDTDGDLDVDLTDLARVLADFGATGAGLAGDADGDGDVDLTDLALVLAHFGASCA